jgi:hypothetical protein
MTPVSDHEPPHELIEQARAFVARKQWIFAKTMPENPHHYVVLFHQQTEEDREGYSALRELITRHGWKRRWHGRMWKTYTLDDHDYWTIHPVINRKPSAEACWEDLEK